MATRRYVGLFLSGYVDPLQSPLFLAFTNELRRRHPKVWIDNCSSGGRRIDLETLTRSLPLWPSDFPDVVGLPPGRGVLSRCLHVGRQHPEGDNGEQLKRSHDE